MALTEWKLRARAEEAGYTVSGKQFRDYREWGLLPDSDESGRWPEEVVDRLIRLGQLRETVRQRPRQVILLRYEGVLVPTHKLRDAMQAVAKTINQPARTMRRVLRARRVLADPKLAITSKKRVRRARSEWRPPGYADWSEILGHADLGFIERWAGLWCYHVATIQAFPLQSDSVSDIPVEEVVTLVAIQDIAASQDQIRNPTEG